jgi:hypothetical protein
MCRRALRSSVNVAMNIAMAGSSESSARNVASGLTLIGNQGGKTPAAA